MKEMNQSEYSIYIKKGLEQEYPDFSNYYRFESDVYILEYPSLKNELVLWISTQDYEITVGFDKNEECIWHTHMSQFGAYEPESELIEAIKFLKGIFTANEKIVINQNNEIYLTDSIEESKDCIIKTWKDF